MELLIKKIGINGEGIGYDNRIPVFVPGALIDEVVECKVIENHQRYKVAELIEIKKKSKDRIKAACFWQKDCGGCPLMTLNYSKQLEVKQDLLIEALRKYAYGLEELVEDIIPSEKVYHYRNQCKLPLKGIRNHLQSGLYISGTNHLVGIKECPVHDELLDKTRLQITQILDEEGLRDYNPSIKKGLRHLVVRGANGKHQVTLVSGNQIISDQVIEKIMALPTVSSLYQNINTSRNTVPIFSEQWKHLAGNKSLMMEAHDLKLKLSAGSFFQLNTEQAFELYSQAIDMIPECDLLVEAYCGIGTMSLLAAKKANEVIGIEIIGSAISSAKENAKINHIKNVQFITGDAAEETTKISKKRKVDVLLIDPPRSGIDDAMLDCIMHSKIKTIVYVSCNPATLAKNLSLLQSRYHVERILPVDMFPNTPLVETIVLLKRD